MNLHKTVKRLLCAAAVAFIAVPAAFAAELDITEIPEKTEKAVNVTVVFTANGGTPAPARQTVEKGAQLPLLPDLSRKGYTFGGWHTDVKFTEPFSIATPIEANTRLYAKWIKNPIVSFSAGGGKPIPARQSVLFGEAVEIPGEPVRAGFTFLGWYTSPRAVEPYDFSTPVSANMTLYAKWVKLPVVTFTGGGRVLRQSVGFGETVSPPANIMRNGYTFDNWYTTARYTREFDFSTPITAPSTTVYAKWVRNPVVRFSTRGRSPVPAPQNILPGERAVEPALDIPEGFMLEGWYSDSAFRRGFSFSEPIGSSMTVYANIVREAGR